MGFLLKFKILKTANSKKIKKKYFFMEKKILQLIIISNKSIWNEKKYEKLAKNGFYEVYFLILNNHMRYD